MKIAAILVGLILMLGGCGLITPRIVMHVQAGRNCFDYLERAANSNSPEMAVGELRTAIGYAESRGWTSGYTSVLYTTPDEDIGFWYKNISQAEKSLSSLPPDNSDLEKSNALMKLRETLLYSGEKGQGVTHPAGLSVYPHNVLWGILLILGIVFVAAGPIVILATFMD